MSLPPLRERIVDIPLLAQHFLTQMAGASAPMLTPDAIALMQEYPWPGNIRELRNVIERVVLLSRGERTRSARRTSRSPRQAAGGSRVGGSAVTLAELERQHIDAVLPQSNWHQGQRGEDARHLVEDAVPEDPRVRLRARPKKS